MTRRAGAPPRRALITIMDPLFHREVLIKRSLLFVRSLLTRNISAMYEFEQRGIEAAAV